MSETVGPALLLCNSALTSPNFVPSEPPAALGSCWSNKCKVRGSGNSGCLLTGASDWGWYRYLQDHVHWSNLMGQDPLIHRHPSSVSLPVSGTLKDIISPIIRSQFPINKAPKDVVPKPIPALHPADAGPVSMPVPTTSKDATLTFQSPAPVPNINGVRF